jgi:hypothetical protein
VAAVFAGLLAVVYVVAVIVLNLLVSARLSEKSEARLTSQLAVVRSDPSQITRPVSGPGAAPRPDDLDSDSAPVYLWAVNADGTVTAHTPGAPSLPASLVRGGTARDGLVVTAGLSPRDAQFKLKLVRQGTGWLVAGQSLAGDAPRSSRARSSWPPCFWVR